MKKLLLFLVIILLFSCGENNDQSAFLKDFYNTLLKNGAAMNIDDAIKNKCTPKFQKFLKDSYREIGYADDNDGYAMWEFIPEFENDAMGDRCEVKNVTALDDNWYKVEYLEQSEEGIRYIHFVESEGSLKMDEITSDEPVITKNESEDIKTESEVTDAADSDSETIKKFKSLIKEPDVYYYAIVSDPEVPYMVLAFKPNKEDDNYGIATRTYADVHNARYRQNNVHYDYSIEGDMLILQNGEFKYEENGMPVKADGLRLKIIELENGYIMLKGTFKGELRKFVQMYISEFNKDYLVW